MKLKVQETGGWSHGKRLLRIASFAVDLWADRGMFCAIDMF